eukprot:CAMPEP_0113276976 /NCGR_PEP_ID=MMETSP0008_2-20120614/25788_1 /TAXON_ID=97485 /ORGANISM="Prymnesium parvum" /LENGTH=35 /DNA_ID=CAMNT_0000126829 /DNA_START=111 /DNA_END=218 /DNA_ORIENTATION=- /assembly_acc=CAM_ASM_000153
MRHLRAHAKRKRSTFTLTALSSSVECCYDMKDTLV